MNPCALATRAAIRPTELTPVVYSPRNCDAARQLFRVTSGLESMIVGEAEVQGQVKRAYEDALAAQTTGPLTNHLFRAALATGMLILQEGDLREHASALSSELRRGAAERPRGWDDDVDLDAGADAYRAYLSAMAQPPLR